MSLAIYPSGYFFDGFEMHIMKVCENNKIWCIKIENPFSISSFCVILVALFMRGELGEAPGYLKTVLFLRKLP
jgi:hypothetical protein